MHSDHTLRPVVHGGVDNGGEQQVANALGHVGEDLEQRRQRVLDGG
ncbi:hypothetical protein PC129_g16562 [Phytophthora cactorum]|uniref:Uncharacterized protein n=1 Tax=Phytophthora cactorum TaxID=29920 RepID=A0A329RMV3_9STRA|nr:hypothetical protein Pcac1_g28320 [Phytophthora cactorum]KAG2808916.1 hypothetical protein PC111_g16280 [Phytophthora cactorum]KAG2844521.1 hypothetical protein PC112_g2198 [Phytophthora cactorum]KAG2847474.1 hypothetical protein PC113_g17754 [Phytophthora cactorum]KAG2887990.1 hypothetical protein PC114_g18575 [Phytophthora cactorum]